MEVLYQLSYSPARDGHDTSAGRAIFGPVRSPRHERRPTHHARHPAAPLQRRARQRDRGESWQDWWGCRSHLLGPRTPLVTSPTACQPSGAATQALRARTCSRTRAAPASTWATPWARYIGTDVYARFMRMQRPQRPPLDGLRRVRAPSRGQRRGADRSAPARHHGSQHREHAPPTAGAGAGPRSAAGRRHHRRGLLPLDAVDLPPAARVLVRRRAGPCPPDRRVAGRARGGGSAPEQRRPRRVGRSARPRRCAATRRRRLLPATRTSPARR